MEVDLFIPCFIDQIYPSTAWNMIRILERAGCKVNYNANQTCCGQPAYNAGYWNMCRDVAEKFINDFPNERPIVSPSASCVGMVKNHYTEMFHNSAYHNRYKYIQNNIYELSEFLVNVAGVTDFGARLEGTAAYHDSCSGLREIGIKKEPRELLANVRGLQLREMEDTDTCCGFGGTFSVKYEPIAVGMAEQKSKFVEATGADYLISTDLSCLMHMQGFMRNQGKQVKMMHLADVLVSGWGESN
ncbi:MAG: (Fe-S)-binding protein [Bacteroidota bacterium]